MFWIYILFATYMTIGVIGVVSRVGKERKPMTGGVAAGVVVISGAMIYLLVTAGINTL